MTGGKDNLIQMDERTKDEQREIAKKGGIASGKTRRRKRTIKEAAKLILGLPVVEDYKHILEAIEAPENSYTNATLLVAKMFELAAAGNTKAAKLLFDFTEENPVHEVNRKRLAILEEEQEKRDTIKDWIEAAIAADEMRAKETAETPFSLQEGTNPVK